MKSTTVIVDRYLLVVVEGQVNLLRHHHLDELFVVDLTVTIDICFADHLVNFFIGKLLSKVCHDVTKFGSRDETISVLIKDLEGFKDFFFTVSVLHLAGHHCQKFREIDSSTSIGINLLFGKKLFVRNDSWGSYLDQMLTALQVKLTSWIISINSASVGFCPRERMTVPNSFVVMVPVVVQNKNKS